jgi:4'-phosphopantetheinyl transferase
MQQDEIHIWKMDAEQFGDIPFEACVIPEELERAGRFATENLRHNWLVSRASLRYILSEYLGINPLEISFSIEKGGKPYIQNSPFHFNLSHSRNHTFIAVSQEKSVGIDCEILKEDIKVEPISRDYFSAVEYEYINSLTDMSERLKAFFRCWTRKESFVKAVGLGMSLSFSDFTVSVKSDELARLIDVKNGMYDPAQWTLGDIDCPGVAAAFAIQSPFVISQIKELSRIMPLSL